MKLPLVVVAGLAVAFALAGCTLGTPTTPSPTIPGVCCGPPTPTATPTTGPTATASGAPTASPTVPPITVPTPGGTSDTPCATDSAGEPDVPPPAKVTAADGSLVLGAVGSYTYCGTSADALPPRSKSLPTAALESPSTVAIQMLGGWGVTGYRAGYWPAAQWQGDEIALGKATYTDPAIAISFDGPPSGNWMLAVHLAFPADGNATYYWHVTVP